MHFNGISKSWDPSKAVRPSLAQLKAAGWGNGPPVSQEPGCRERDAATHAE